MERLSDKCWRREKILITTQQEKMQLILEKILSGSADSTAQASLLASLFGGFVKKTIKRKTLNIILSFTSYIKLCEFIPKLSFTDKISSSDLVLHSRGFNLPVPCDS